MSYYKDMYIATGMEMQKLDYAAEREFTKLEHLFVFGGWQENLHEIMAIILKLGEMHHTRGEYKLLCKAYNNMIDWDEEFEIR